MSYRESYKPGTPCWVDLGTPDIDASTAYYGALFGWEAMSVGPPEETDGYGHFLIDEQRIGGYRPLHGEGHPPVWATYLATDDIDATVAAARAAGANIVAEPMTVGPAGRVAFIQDPSKAVVGLWQAGYNTGAERVNEPNAWAWNELTTRDVEAAKAFYPRVLPMTSEDQQMGPMHYTTWKVDGEPVAGMLAMPDGVPEQMPSYWAVYFAVENCDAAVAKAVELGGSIVVPAMDIPIGRFCFVADPHGAAFAVMQFNESPAT